MATRNILIFIFCILIWHNLGYIFDYRLDYVPFIEAGQYKKFINQSVRKSVTNNSIHYYWIKNYRR